MTGDDPFFDPLTGILRVPADAPEAWRAAGLGAFYTAPNQPEWGRSLCRVLYHESLHFWQVFSSSYVAGLLGEEWSRLLLFEATGEIGTPSDAAVRHWQTPASRPFSAGELAECWARYWDLHTRGPHAIVEDEEITLPPGLVSRIRDPFTGTPSYTGPAYDYLVQHGREASDYERPYRWLLERTGGHSPFAVLTFPILAHAAFATPDPVGVFCDAIDRAWESPLIQDGIRTKRTGNVNIDWLNHWAVILGEAAVPVTRDRGLPFRGGFEEIAQGPLASHPVYGEFGECARILGGHVKLFRMNWGPAPAGDPQALFDFACADLAHREPWVVFGLPGQPAYRKLLGDDIRPPRIVFANYAWNGRRPVTLWLQEQLQGQPAEPDYSARVDDLERRARRFRAAEKAVSLGLPADAFEAAETRVPA